MYVLIYIAKYNMPNFKTHKQVLEFIKKKKKNHKVGRGDSSVHSGCMFIEFLRKCFLWGHVGPQVVYLDNFNTVFKIFVGVYVFQKFLCFLSMCAWCVLLPQWMQDIVRHCINKYLFAWIWNEPLISLYTGLSLLAYQKWNQN